MFTNLWASESDQAETRTKTIALEVPQNPNEQTGLIVPDDKSHSRQNSDFSTHIPLSVAASFGDDSTTSSVIFKDDEGKEITVHITAKQEKKLKKILNTNDRFVYDTAVRAGLVYSLLGDGVKYFDIVFTSIDFVSVGSGIAGLISYIVPDIPNWLTYTFAAIPPAVTTAKLVIQAGKTCTRRTKVMLDEKKLHLIEHHHNQIMGPEDV